MMELAFTLVWFGLVGGVLILAAILGHMIAQTFAEWRESWRR